MSTPEPERTHPVHVVHRVGAAAVAVVLLVFAVLGYADGLAPFSTQGSAVMGMSSNGLLSTVSVIASAVLLTAAAWRGKAASTIAAVMGGLFLMSGLVHLMILDSALNVLDFGLTNVYFSLASGMLLLFLGLYGRLTGGLPDDNPYRVSRAAHHLQQHPQETSGVHQRPRVGDPMKAANEAQTRGRATPEQRELLNANEERESRPGSDSASSGVDSEPGAPFKSPGRDMTG